VDAEFFLAGLLVLGFFLGPWIWLFSHRGRLRRLDAEVAELRTKLGLPPRQPEWVPPDAFSPATPSPAEGPLPEPVATPQPVPEPAAMRTSGWAAGQVPPEPDPGAAPEPVAAPPVSSGPSGWARFERELTSRWSAWGGALAVGLGAIFLVKYSIDAGLFGPTARIACGILLGLALLGASEWVRRRPIPGLPEGMQVDHVPAALSGAGLVALFGSIYAGYELYALFPAVVAFAMLAGVAALALAASLLHGGFTAGLGAIAAYMVPGLVSTGSPQVWVLVLYLLVVTAGIVALLRYRAWLWLGGIVIGANVLWQLAAQTVPGQLNHLLLALHAIAVPGMLFAWLAPEPREAPDLPLYRWLTQFGPLDWLLAAASLAGLLGLASQVHNDGYGQIGVAIWTVAIVLAGWQARRSPRDVYLPLVAAVLTVALATSWTLAEPEPGFSAPGYWTFAVVPNAAQDYLMPVALFGALFAVGGYVLLWGSAQAGVWASLSAGVPVALLAVAYAQVMCMEVSIPWALCGLTLAGLHLGAAERVGRYRDLPTMLAALAAFAVMAPTAVALAAAMALRDAWLSVSIAAILPAAGWLWRRLRVGGLRWLAAIVAGVLAARLALNPFIIGYEIGATPVFNWLLYGYGLPLVFVVLAVRLFRDGADDWLTYMLRSTALGLGFVLLTLEVVHLSEGGRFDWTNQSLLRDGMLAVGWLVLGYGQLRADRVAPHLVRGWAWRILTVLSIGWLCLVVVLFDNPLFNRRPVGEWPIVNLIQLAYGLPAVALLLIAFECRRQGRPGWVIASGATALVLGFVAVNLEVRHAFTGPVLYVSMFSGPWPGQAESLAYSAAWLGYGIALLALGLWRKNHAVRYASLGVVMLTVAKVFLFDLSELVGVYRAFSFIGLGLCLIGIGYAYRRFVFARLPGSAAGPPAQPESPDRSTPAS